MSQQNNTRLMCEYPIYGTVSDVSRMNTGVIYVRPCYFKQGVDKEIPVFLRDAKKEHWATKENLKVGTKLTFRIRLDQYKGPMAVDLTTVDATPKDAYSKPYRPKCIPDADGFRRIIDEAKRKKLEASSNPVDQLFDSMDIWAYKKFEASSNPVDQLFDQIEPVKELNSIDLWAYRCAVINVIDEEERLSAEQKHNAVKLAFVEIESAEDSTIRANRTNIFAEAAIETILDEDYDKNDREAVHDLFIEKYDLLVARHENLEAVAQLSASLGF